MQPLNVTSLSARQKVAPYLMQQLSTPLGVGDPGLTVGERVEAAAALVALRTASP